MLLFIVTVLCVYCVGKTIIEKRSRRQQQVERNFYSTDSIQRVHGPLTQSIPLHDGYMLRPPIDPQSSTPLHGGYILQPHHVQPPLPSPDVNDTYTERSSEELLPEHEDHSMDEEEHDPQYFILDKDYIDRATLQIR